VSRIDKLATKLTQNARFDLHLGVHLALADVTTRTTLDALVVVVTANVTKRTFFDFHFPRPCDRKEFLALSVMLT